MGSFLRRALTLAAAICAAFMLGWIYARAALGVQAAANPVLAATAESAPTLAGMADFVSGAAAGRAALPSPGREPMGDVLALAALRSAVLFGASFGVSALIGLGLGAASVRDDPPAVARWLAPVSALGQSLPVFLIATMLALSATALGAQNPIVSTSSSASPLAYAIAVVAVSLYPIAKLSTVTSALLVAELRKPYARTARSFGYPERVILGRLVARNVAAPVVLTLASMARLLIMELVIVEWLFQLRGLGWLLAATLVPAGVGQGAGTRLFLYPPLVASLFAIYAAGFALLGWMGDALAHRVDPRLRTTQVDAPGALLEQGA